MPPAPRLLRLPQGADRLAAGTGFFPPLTGSEPVRGGKKPVPEFTVALAVIARADRIFIQQRPEEGHLGGLWEFPGGKCRPGEEPAATVARECREELGAEIAVLEKLAEVRHAYSHFKVHLHVFACRLPRGRIRPLRPHSWVSADELENFPFPAANHKFFPAVSEFLEKGMARDQRRMRRRKRRR